MKRLLTILATALLLQGCSGTPDDAGLAGRWVEKGKECIGAAHPEPGQPFVGICQRDDAGCGSFIEIHKGRAEPAYHID